MNIAQKIDKTLLQNAIDSTKTKGKTHGGYSAEEFIILALGFTEEDGTPYRSKKQGGSQIHTQTFDVPKDVAERNPILPKNLKTNWSIKMIERGSCIGLGMASSQYDAWAKDGLVQATCVYELINGKKVIIDLMIHKIKPSPVFWGNLTKERIAEIDPMIRKDKSIAWSKEQAKKLNKWSNGAIGIRNISRDFINDKGKRRISRNLQCYMTFSTYMKLVA